MTRPRSEEVSPPMAQDSFAVFGHDGVGQIGSRRQSTLTTCCDSDDGWKSARHSYRGADYSSRIACRIAGVAKQRLHQTTADNSLATIYGKNEAIRTLFLVETPAEKYRTASWKTDLPSRSGQLRYS